jgi:cellulose synthase operon protein C
LAKETLEAVLKTGIGALRASPSAKEQFSRVEAWFKQANLENPTQPIIELQADFYDLQGRYAEAMTLYRQMLKTNRNNLLALNNLAWLLALHQNNTEALELMKKAMDIAGPIPEFLDTRGVIYMTLNKNSEALDDLQAAVKMTASGQAAYTYFHLACAQARTGKFDSARESFQRAKAAGITVDTVHPLERQEFQRLASELDAKGI